MPGPLIDVVVNQMIFFRKCKLFSSECISAGFPTFLLGLMEDRSKGLEHQAKAPLVKNGERHLARPYMGSRLCLLPSIPILVPGLIGSSLSPTHLNNKREPPVERS